MSLTTVLSIQLRPERTLEYEELCRVLAEKAVAKHDPGHYTMHQTLYGEAGRVHFVSQEQDWSGLSARGPAQGVVLRVLGEKEGRRWLQSALECSSGSRIEVAVDRPDLSYPPEETRAIHPLAVLTLVQVRPGGQDACEELLRKIAEAIPKLGDPGRLITHQTLVGNLAQYWTVRPLRDLSELDATAPPQELLNQAFGPAEGGLIFRSGLEAIEAVEREVVAYRPDLSNPPSA